MDTATYNKYWNLWCDQYDPDNLELENIRRLVHIEGKDILEIGCGNGRLTRFLAKHAKRVVGIDKDSKMIESARKLTSQDNISYATMDALDLSVEGSFDIVLFTWSLVCIYKQEEIALQNAKQVLKDKGSLVLVEPGGPSDYGKVVKPYLPKDYPEVDITESYEQPIIKVFGTEPKKIGPVKIPYRFHDLEETTAVFRFAIEEWHKQKVSSEDALKESLRPYNNILYESVYFYEVKK